MATISQELRSFLNLAQASLEDSTFLDLQDMKSKRLSHKTILGYVEEDENEPPEEETAYTSRVLRLAAVESGLFVEWAKLGPVDGLSKFPLWSMDADILPTPSCNFSDAEDDFDEYGDEMVDEHMATSSQDLDFGRSDVEKKLKRMANDPYVLMSFGRRGEAELIRLIFVAAGEKYLERNVLEEEIDKVLEQDTPYQSLPVLFKGPFSWGGSEAITRMLAKKFYFMGETNHEHLIVEAMFERLCRLKRAHGPVIQHLSVEIKKREKMDWVDHQLRYVILPPSMAEWEKLIMSSKGPYIVASGMSLADLAIVDFLDQCGTKINIKDLLADFDVLADLFSLVKKQPRIAAYLDDRNDKDRTRKLASDTHLPGR